MSRYSNINESIKSTSRKYSLNLKDANENIGDIELNNVNNGKQAKGKFSVNDDILKISIIESSYNDSYLKNTIIKDLLDSNIGVNNIEINFNLPKVGRTIATKLFQYKNEGYVGTLNVGQYYFSVDNDLVDCNGWQLRKSFSARLVKKIETRCEGANLPALTYTFFILIAEL